MMTAPYPPVDGTQACATGGTDTAVAAAFLGQPATDTSAAKLACHECTFLRPCRAYGLTHDVHEIWGGWDTVDRGGRPAASTRCRPHRVSSTSSTPSCWRRDSAPS